MRAFFSFSFIGLLLTVAVPVQAQMDFAQQMILNGRYEIKKTGPAKPKAKPRHPSSEETAAPAKLDASPAPAAAATTSAAEAKALPVEPQASAVAKPAIPVENSVEKRKRMAVEVLFGANDTRSISNYSYREYNTTFPFLQLGTEIYLDPRWTLEAEMGFSMDASIPGDAATNSTDHVTDDQMRLGVRYMTPSSPEDSVSASYDFNYLERSFDVSSDSTSHMKLRSSGVGLGGSLYWRPAPSRAYVFRGLVYPRLQHSESKTSINVVSGDSNDSMKMLLELSGEFAFKKADEFIFGVQAASERNRFSGAASAADVRTGATPSNVTVTDSSLSLFFGYRWGR